MGNLMTSMYTGVSGLKVSQASLNTTAHNLSNVDTTGFTRQQILTVDFSYNTIGQSYNSAMQIGLGTDMSIIRQVRDVFMDKAYRLETGRQGFYETQYAAVNEIENLFGELDGVAFKDELSGLWSAISDVATEPDSIVKRGILVSTAQGFINRAAVISTQLQEYQENLNSQIQEKVDRINEIGEQIRDLNTAIRRYESSDQQANDLRDTRNLLLDELGELVNISYKEDMSGAVSINIEGVQFLVDEHITYLATEKVILDGEQEKADTINDLADKLKTKIEAGTTLEDLKKSDEWKELREYGNIVAKTDANGKIYVERNGAPLISVDGAGNYEITEVLPKESNMLNVVWKGNGLGSVFRLTGDYNSASNTDVGSLKGILVARGSYAAKYTDIPKEADYLDANGDLDEDAYKAAIASYNKNVDASTVMMTQAQFDQLIHDVVVAINDVLCPNTDVNEENLTALLEKKGATTGGLTKVTVRLEDGTELSYDDSLLMLDELNASTGMDEDNTIGEALFNRKSTDRYTKATLLDDNGDTIQDAQGNDIVVYIYNQEYESNNYSLFTIDELEINEAILQDYSKIPLTYNTYSGLYGGYDFDRGVALLNLFDDKGLRLDPNSLTNYNYADYYSAMTSGIAYRGSLYSGMVDQQEIMTSSLDDKRQEVAGVSSDEELTNLIMYQYAYNASSRYINVINEMLEHIINRLGS